ncbi:hypothetical protein D3C86_1864440 [compost metagenome]
MKGLMVVQPGQRVNLQELVGNRPLHHKPLLGLGQLLQMLAHLTGTDNDSLGHDNEHDEHTFHQPKLQQRLLQHLPLQPEINPAVKQQAEYTKNTQQPLVKID